MEERESFFRTWKETNAKIVRILKSISRTISDSSNLYTGMTIRIVPSIMVCGFPLIVAFYYYPPPNPLEIALAISLISATWVGYWGWIFLNYLSDYAERISKTSIRR